MGRQPNEETEEAAIVRSSCDCGGNGIAQEDGRRQRVSDVGFVRRGNTKKFQRLPCMV